MVDCGPVTAPVKLVHALGVGVFPQEDAEGDDTALAGVGKQCLGMLVVVQGPIGEGYEDAVVLGPRLQCSPDGSGGGFPRW